MSLKMFESVVVSAPEVEDVLEDWRRVLGGY